jgi:hypothetical protein
VLGFAVTGAAPVIWLRRHWATDVAVIRLRPASGVTQPSLVIGCQTNPRIPNSPIPNSLIPESLIPKFPIEQFSMA